MSRVQLADKPLCQYRPRDLGYVVPLANGRGCGKVLGITVRGRLPFLLNYFFCVFRSWSTANKKEIVKSLFSKS